MTQEPQAILSQMLSEVLKNDTAIGRVFVTGVTVAGKSTFISTICDGDVSTILSTSGSTVDVALDFGVMRAGSLAEIHFYANPGAARFKLEADVFQQPFLGVLVLFNGYAPYTFREATALIHYITANSKLPIVVVNNPFEYAPHITYIKSSEILRGLLGLPNEIPLVTCDVTNKESTHEVLLTLLREVKA